MYDYVQCKDRMRDLQCILLQYVQRFIIRFIGTLYFEVLHGGVHAYCWCSCLNLLIIHYVVVVVVVDSVILNFVMYSTLLATSAAIWYNITNNCFCRSLCQPTHPCRVAQNYLRLFVLHAKQTTFKLCRQGRKPRRGTGGWSPEKFWLGDRVSYIPQCLTRMITKKHHF